MRLIKAISNGFKNYANINGVSNRGDFWFWLLFVCIFLCITLIIDGAFFGPWIANLSGQEVMAFDQDAPKWLSLVSLFLLLIPTLTVAMRRIQDAGFSKWWILIGLTIIGCIPLLIIFFKKGKKLPKEEN